MVSEKLSNINLGDIGVRKKCKFLRHQDGRAASVLTASLGGRTMPVSEHPCMAEQRSSQYITFDRTSPVAVASRSGRQHQTSQHHR